MDEIAVLKHLVLDMLPWIAHRDQCPTPDGGTDCTCGTSDILQRALDVLGPTDVDSPTEPTEIPIQVDTRPRCGVLASGGTGIFCDKPRGHEGQHEAYYGWSGKVEVWS